MTDEDRARLILKYEGLVRRLVRLYAHAGFSVQDLEDMRQEGRVGLIVAAQKYDPHRERTFTLFAKRTISHYVLAERARKIRVRRERTWGGDRPEPAADPVEAAIVDDAYDILDGMTPFEQAVLRDYFGMSNGSKSYLAVARKYRITEHRVKLIVHTFRRKLFDRLGM